MYHRSKIALAALAVALALAACGGSEEDDSSSYAPEASASLTGSWYSSSVKARWDFGSTGSGLLMQGSIDGTACRLTWVDYTLDAANSRVTYYITRAMGTGVDNSYDSGPVREGPYTMGYTLSGNSVTLGAGTYSRSSTRPAGCESA